MLGRRPDGYHSLVSVFQSLTLADVLEFQPGTELLLRCEPPLPFDDNLALRAAKLLREQVGVTSGAQVTLRKRIPIAAGLGGGSADAAAALVGLARLWNAQQPSLVPLAAELGSDVPYFLGNATALVEGRGEVVRPLPPLPVTHLVLVRPRVSLSTRDVFQSLRPAEWGDGASTRTLAERLRAGDGLAEELLRNDLQTAAERCCPPLGAARQRLEAAGLHPHLTGTGPTLFLLADGASDAKAMARLAQVPDVDVLRCRTVRSKPVQVRVFRGA